MRLTQHGQKRLKLTTRREVIEEKTSDTDTIDGPSVLDTVPHVTPYAGPFNVDDDAGQCFLGHITTGR